MYRYEDLPKLMTTMTGDEKHAPSATSTLDVLWTLYDRVLHLTPQTVDAPDRDRFLLSKGHGPMAFYAVLAAKGFIPGSGSMTLAASTRHLATTPTETWFPESRSPAARLATDYPSRWESRLLSMPVRTDTLGSSC